MPVEDLARGRRRQAFRAHHKARHAMGRDLVAHQRLQHLGQPVPVRALAQHHMGHDDLGADRVGRPHHGGHDHVGMAGQRLFDLDRADPVTRRGDHVVVAGMEHHLPVVAQRARDHRS
jgi:hypothetical protein